MMGRLMIVGLKVGSRHTQLHQVHKSVNEAWEVVANLLHHYKRLKSNPPYDVIVGIVGFHNLGYLGNKSRSSDIMEPNASQSLPFKRLLGQVAIITGGARGIGAATARLFAENGAYVVVADILDDLGTSLAESIGGLFIHCDVTKEAHMESAVIFALAWKGRLDIMFNNAGIAGVEGSITILDMGQLESLISVNVHGVVHGIKHAAKAMIEGRRGGSIICTSSTAGIMGGLASHGYTLSKGAIIGLVRSSACELGVHHIRVNCISPHGVPSEMLLGAFRRFLGKEDVTAEDISREVGQKGSLLKGRGSTADDVANAALFLASKESGFVTGHNLVVDGGFTCACSNMSYIYK